MGKQNSRRSQSAAAVPVALTIAGSDSSAGAGIQADLKTFSALGVYGLTAVAKAIRGIESLRGRRIPLVIDPVMIASSGDRLLEAAAIDAYTDQLFPLATLITPNLDEAALLIGTEIKDRERMEKATKALASKYRAAILLKGGHLRGDNAIDLLFHKNKLTEFSARFVRGVATHGTGCTYSAAIAAGLACGLVLEKAIGQAKKFVTKSIAEHLRWTSPSGKNLDALRHFL